MAGFSDAYETAILNHVFRTTALAQASSVYVSLHTADPGDTGASEVSGGSYARAAVSRADASWNAPATSGSGKAITNAGAIAFPTATADWGTVTHVGFWDAASAGTFIAGGALTSDSICSPVSAIQVLKNRCCACRTTGPSQRSRMSTQGAKRAATRNSGSAQFWLPQ